jgi:hypothetical protein
MYFPEEDKRNSNNEKIGSLNDFLIKLQSSKKEDELKAKKKESLQNIQNNIKEIRSKIVLPKFIKEKNENLLSVLKLLDAKSFNDNQIKQLITTCFTKLKNELLKIFHGFCNNSSILLDLVENILSLYNKIPTNNNMTCEFLSNNIELFSLIFITLAIKIYYNIVLKGKLVDEFNQESKLMNSVIKIIENSDVKIKTEIYKFISLKKYFCFIYYRILYFSKKIIDKQLFKNLTLSSISICNEIVLVNSNQTLLCDISVENYFNYIQESNKSISKLSSNLQKFTNVKQEVDKAISITDIIKIMRKAKNFSLLKNFSSDFIIDILKSNSNQSLNKESINQYILYLTELHNLFIILSQKTICNEKVDKQQVIITLLHILEKAFEPKFDNFASNSKAQEYKVYLELCKNKILLISATLEVFINIYSQNHETLPSNSILDYIFNKSITKNNKLLLDEIILYSHETYVKPEWKYKQAVKNRNSLNYNLNGYTYKKTFDQHEIRVLEIIAFALEQKIQYKSDNFSLLYSKKFKSISDNIPFNPFYLKEISAVLIRAFTFMLGDSNYNEDFAVLKSNLIISSLKSLYDLDNESEFSGDKEEFWSNSELLIKLLLYDKSRQLEVIKIIPFIFPIKFRIDCFYSLIKKKKTNRELLISLGMGHDVRVLDLKVSRNNLFDQALGLYLEGSLKHKIPWKITFVNKLGMVEDGQDAGGLFMEFLMKLSEEAFSKEAGFFVESTTGFLIPNANSNEISEYHLNVFEFLGFIVGVAVLNETQIWPNLSTFFLNNVLGIANPLIELKNYDYELYKNLISLMDYEGNIEDDLCLNFSISEKLKNGKTIEKELIPNGTKIPVNKDNKLLYIRRLTQYKLETQFKPQCEAFKVGLQKVLDEELYKLFTANDFRQVIAGFDRDIDLIDWKLNTNYNHFNMSNPAHTNAINTFWEIVWELDTKEIEKLLFFVTSLKRPPLTVSSF